MSESRLRLIKQLSSSIFSIDPPKLDNSIRPIKRIVRDLSDNSFAHGSRSQTPTNSTLRPIDHSGKDLFGNFPTEYYRKDIKGIFKSTAAAVKKTQNDVSDKIHNRKSADLTVKNYCKVSNLCESQKNLPQFRPKSSEIRVDSLAISGLTGNDNENTIKALCKGLHVVQITTETDNLTGKCSGKAVLQVRSHKDSLELESLKQKLTDKGLELGSIAATRGKRNSYTSPGIDFLNPHLQAEEKRLKTNLLTCNERKRVILSTSDDLFGNSPGTGKWDRFTPRKCLKENRETEETLRKWTLTKNSERASPFCTAGHNSSYSRATISSQNKFYSKKYDD